MLLGLIADTHNQLDPRVEKLFAGVDLILHAGDVCRPALIAELEAIAPVTVVLGNNDSHFGWRENEVVEAEGHRILLRHIVSPARPAPDLRERLARIRPNLVVYGHTHRHALETRDGIAYLNPGSAGAPRFGLPRSVCRLHLGPGTMRAEFVDLDGQPLAP